ncbi:MAG: sigma factor, partial [Pseudonocardiaceae bacterium]
MTVGTVAERCSVDRVTGTWTEVASETVRDRWARVGESSGSVRSRRPRRPPMTGTTAVTPAVSPVESERGEYAHLIPLQRRYAELAAEDPERQRLRGQLISGYLPLAHNIARRFAGRGEALDDLVQVATVGLIYAVDRFDP